MTVNATTLGVKDKKNAPMLWKWQMADDWGHPRLPGVSTVDDQSAAMK
jgi:hypothetical protein